MELLRQAAEVLPERELSGLSEPELDRELEALESVRRVCEARQVRLAGELRARRTRRLREAGADPVKAGQRAERQTRQQLREELSWTASQAKNATATGRGLQRSAAAGEAFDRGRLPAAHARVLADTVALLDPDDAARVERELLAWAQREDAVAFGRRARRLLAEIDHQAAERAETRRRARRGARIAQGPDGMTTLSGQWSGLDGELVNTGIQAFRRPDAPGEGRTAEQRTADAVVAMAKAALDAGKAPTEHGVRPHVQVTIDYRALLAEHGLAETAWSGPVPFAEVRRLLADCGVSRLLVDAEQAPVEAGEAVRSVPAGLWRALLARDGGCIAVGCDLPAVWCQVMHLATPYRFNGRLTLDTAGLGCSHHHRQFDEHGWELTWHGRRPVLHPPGRPPAADGPDAEEVARPSGPGARRQKDPPVRSASENGSRRGVEGGWTRHRGSSTRNGSPRRGGVARGDGAERRGGFRRGQPERAGPGQEAAATGLSPAPPESTEPQLPLDEPPRGPPP